MKNSKVTEVKVKRIPKLPRGQGSMYVSGDGKYIIYKKMVDGKRIEVQDVTVKAVMKKMSDKEKKCNSKEKLSKQTLYDAMHEWLFLKKRPQLKPSSFDRLETTINNQIKLNALGIMRYQQITSKDIQNLLIALNDFYRDTCIEQKIDNPMLTVKMINKENMNVKEKQIEFLSENEVDRFVREATKLTIDERP